MDRGFVTDGPCGIELREAVAVKIMRRVMYDYLVINETRYDGRWFRQPGINPDSPPAGEHVMASCPYYDEDLNVAWHVVEEMRRRGFAMQLTTTGNGGWHATFQHLQDDDRRRATRIAPTAMVAICRAALAAVGE